MGSSLERRQGIERRNAIRYPLVLPTQLNWIVAGRVRIEEALSRDVSIEGLFVESKSSLEVGSTVNVSVTLPSPGGASPTFQIKGEGTVVRPSGAAESTGLAIAIRLQLAEERAANRRKAIRARVQQL